MTYLSSFHSREVLQKHNVTFSRLVQEASYRLNEDFEIKMGDRYLVTQYSLKLGRNKIKYDTDTEIEVMVQEIPSPMFGFCLLIIHTGARMRFLSINATLSTMIPGLKIVLYRQKTL